MLAKYSTLILILLYILLGVVFYTNEEDWSVLNSMFFIMFTLTTVGYGCPDCPTYVRKEWSGCCVTGDSTEFVTKTPNRLSD